jgi:vacuolar-type H+-ATPase subunit F/Vma7
MSSEERFPDREWEWGENFDQGKVTNQILQDIRAELRRIRRILECPNFTRIPVTLRTISRNTAMPKKARKR